MTNGAQEAPNYTQAEIDRASQEEMQRQVQVQTNMLQNRVVELNIENGRLKAQIESLMAQAPHVDADA